VNKRHPPLKAPMSSSGRSAMAAGSWGGRRLSLVGYVAGRGPGAEHPPLEGASRVLVLAILSAADGKADAGAAQVGQENRQA
jgi:hypothetical protein